MHHSIPNAIFNGTKGLSQGARDFRVTHPLKICHFQWDSLLFRQSLQSFLDSITSVGKNEGVAFRRNVGRLRICIKLVRPGLLPISGSNAVYRARARDCQKPRDRFPAGCIISWGLLPHLPEDIGQDVL